MSTSKQLNDASASAKGTIYQIYVAVDKCVEMVAGQKVLIEKLGDVTVSEEAQIEIKHYADTLTDNHDNIWKTLKNWMQDDFNNKHFVSLILYTTQQFGENALLKSWNELLLEKRIETLKSILVNSETRD